MSDIDLAEAFSTVFNQRRSIRAFRNAPVPRDLIEKVFTLAQRAPSNCNTQPWFAHIVSGATRDRLAERLTADAANGEFDMDFVYDGKYTGVYKERQYASADVVYSAAGIERSNKSARHEHFMANYQFWGAPHVVLLFLPEPFGLREACDLGMYAQSIMLALSANGLASCPQTTLGINAGAVREELNIDASQKLMFGISFGYAAQKAPVNEAWTAREDLENVATFYE